MAVGAAVIEHDDPPKIAQHIMLEILSGWDYYMGEALPI